MANPKYAEKVIFGINAFTYALNRWLGILSIHVAVVLIMNNNVNNAQPEQEDEEEEGKFV